MAISIRSQTRQLPLAQMRAAFVPGSVNVEKRTVELIWTTGAKVLRNSWFDGPFYEELSLDPKHVRMGRLNNGAPLLMDHDGSIRSVVGVVESATLLKSEGRAVVRFPPPGVKPEADQLFELARAGIVQNISVGYRTYKFEKIKGGEGETPTFRATDWEPYELSAVAMGADDGAGFRSADKSTHECVFVTDTRFASDVQESVKQLKAAIALHEKHMDGTAPTTGAAGAKSQQKMMDQMKTALSALDDDEESSGKMSFDQKAHGVTPEESRTMEETEIEKAARLKREAEAKAEQQRKTAEEAALQARGEQAAAEERERITGIQHAVRTVKLGAEVADKMIADKTSLAEARKIVLEKAAEQSDKDAPNSHHRAATVTDDAKDKFHRGVSAWLFERSGNSKVQEAKAKKLKGFVDLELDPGEFRGMSLVDVARECLELKGVSTRGIRDRFKLVEMAIAHRASPGYTSTGDFAVLFENVMYKQMRAAYDLAAQTWRRWIKTDKVQDFRAANRYLAGSFGTLPKVGESEEYKNVPIPDGAKVQISTEKRGAIISISREAIINDDMGALANLSAQFGDGAAESVEEQAYLLLAQNAGKGPTMSDGQPFFHAVNRGNVGTQAALSAASLGADKVLMRKQKDISGNRYLSLVPRILLIPIVLEDAAKILNTDAFDPAQTGQKSNSARGMFGDIVSSPRLDAVSATRRYLFTEGKEAFVCVFLESSGEGPTLESHEDFRRDGMSWKARMEFKVQAYDPKHAVVNDG